MPLIWNNDKLLFASVGKLAMSLDCCCDTTGVGCSGNCICTLTELIAPGCNSDETPTAISIRFNTAVTCPGACTGIPAATYNLPRDNDDCCTYSADTPPGFNCCDCVTEVDSASGTAEFTFTCARNAGNCVIIADLTFCNGVYQKVGWDLTATSGSPNVMTKQDDPPGACCTYPATVDAW